MSKNTPNPLVPKPSLPIVRPATKQIFPTFPLPKVPLNATSSQMGFQMMLLNQLLQQQQRNSLNSQLSKKVKTGNQNDTNNTDSSLPVNIKIKPKINVNMNSNPRKRKLTQVQNKVTRPKKKKKKQQLQQQLTEEQYRSKPATNGLRYFAKLVCEKVKTKKKTTYNEVTDELVKEFCSDSTSADDQKHEKKNVRRRVYDCLNVLIALDIITKNRKEITWKGYPINPRQEFESLYKQKENLEISIDQKRRRCVELENQRLSLKKLFDRNNREGFEVDEASKLYLPFIIVHTDKETVIECQMDSLTQECFFSFSDRFDIHDDNEILQRIFTKDALDNSPLKILE